MAACHAIRDGILDDELICDYVLFKLNREKLFTYVKKYNVGQAVDNVHDLLNAVETRLGLNNRTAACENFLADFRDGKLGKITLDELS